MNAPASTYRFQVTADRDLAEVARRLPYLHDLGIDWVYLSPLLQAEPGSDTYGALLGLQHGLALCQHAGRHGRSAG